MRPLRVSTGNCLNAIYERPSGSNTRLRHPGRPMATRRQVVDTKRRIPRQARATETVETILEGAAQVLEAGGLAAFTTNAVAERAGVSIGTLYQYFADKDALVQAIAERELKVTLGKVAESLRNHSALEPAERARGVVRAIVNAFGGRQ